MSALATRRGLLSVAAALAVAAGLAVGIRQAFFAGDSQASRPELQRVLDRLVTGPGRIAPGVTAYVSGPKGTWVGAAGVANLRTGERMHPDARMRLASISKWYAATLVLQLVQEHRLRLDDTVERWLPGLLPYGAQITLPQLMTDTSGLIDDNDVTPQTLPAMLARVDDAEQRAQMQGVVADLVRHPDAEASALWPIRLAAYQDLLFAPGSRYHHSNIGWNVLGFVAERAGGKKVADLYRERIFQPLGLDRTAFDPQGQIEGPHAEGYSLAVDGRTRDTTAENSTKFVDGGIVSTSEEVGAFFTALMRGKLVDSDGLGALEARGLVDDGGTRIACAGVAHVGDGASGSYKTNVLVAKDGTRVAVVLLNGATLRADGRIDLERSDGAATAAVRRLFCSA